MSKRGWLAALLIGLAGVLLMAGCSDPKSEDEQVERLKKFKENRDHDELNKKLEELRETAKGDGNLLVSIRAALKANATLGEVCGVMRDEFGEYQEA